MPLSAETRLGLAQLSGCTRQVGHPPWSTFPLMSGRLLLPMQPMRPLRKAMVGMRFMCIVPSKAHHNTLW